MVGILAEKPSQARNFASALGGMSGTYGGVSYTIVPARGHLFEFKSPDTQVASYKSWDMGALPWDEGQFSWEYTKKKDSADTLKNIKSVLGSCDEICVGTDLDPSGEGDLLAFEILSELKLTSKNISRMHFTDESAKEIQKAFTNRFAIPNWQAYPDYMKAYFRARWDFLSMQFTRIATLAVGQHKTVLRQGRLKSAMVVIVGDQLKAIAEYVKKPYFQNRFRDENGVVYTNPEEPTFPTEAEVPKQYSTSSVTVDSKTKKSSAPPKLIDLATLSSMLAPKGFKAQEVLSTYQKMYENKVVSYPRTEDKYITPEQFNELLPLTDKIAAVVGVDPALVSHRTPRKTHVKTGCAHGANRPGPNVPSSLESLTSFGPSAPAIYEILAKNYLAMMGEDYEYEQQKGHVTDYPAFTGTANVPLSLGYKKIFSDMDEPDEDESKGLGTTADPFVYEGCNPKPQTPTMKWLMKQLEKHDVGTGATRTSTYSEVTSTKTNCPLLKDSKGKISMTDYGDMSYQVLPGTHIGSLDITMKVQEQMKGIAEGKLNAEDCLREIRKMVLDDIATMTANAKSAGIEQKPAVQKEKASGMFNGEQVSFNREWSGHRFTDEEVEKLLNGEEIVLTGVVGKSGKPFDVKGRLSEQNYKGKKFFGFEKTEFVSSGAGSPDRASGTWNGKSISFKKSWGGHTFTNDEIARLLAGEEIEITGLQSKSGSTYGVKGKLSEQTYNGRKFVGFEKTDFIKNNTSPMDSMEAEKEKYTGMFNGQQVSFNRLWGGHRFTDEECEKLCDGETITITGLKAKSGKTYGVKGKLSKQSFKGHSFYGFEKTEFA